MFLYYNYMHNSYRNLESISLTKGFDMGVNKLGGPHPSAYQPIYEGVVGGVSILLLT